MTESVLDIISQEQAITLAGLFRERVRRSPDRIAYRQFDLHAGAWRDMSWREAAEQVGRWQAALGAEQFEPGDRIAILLRNCIEWVLLDQAALGLGLVVVPLYVEDSADNIAYILRDSGARLLLIEGAAHWQHLQPVVDGFPDVTRIVSLDSLSGEPHDPRLRWSNGWLPASGALRAEESTPDALATIVYTSGTTGMPKGVRLSHRNIVWNAHAGLGNVPVYPDDLYLSFLPLCHTLERSIGYYLMMMSGATVAYARSIPQLGEDLLTIRPTVLVSVPRIFERVYNRIRDQLQTRPSIAKRLFDLTVDVGWRRFEHAQGRAGWSPRLLLWPLLGPKVSAPVMARLGGRVRVAITGGAPLSPSVARVFIGLGLNLLQGYGLTESSPVISVNRQENNIPSSVGSLLESVEVQFTGEQELLVRSPGVMLGYWNNPDASARTVDAQGWLHTGDKACMTDGHLYITGRLKEIIVLANGKKIPPADMEMAITMDAMFEQAMVIGEARPYLCAVLVLNPEQWQDYCDRHGKADPDAALDDPALHQTLKHRIGELLQSYPGFAQIRGIILTLTPWTVENGLITPTLKLKREPITARFHDRIEQLYNKR